MQKFKNILGKIGIEMIPIVLGILVALFINNWKESNADADFRDKVMGAIVEELKENKLELEEKIPEHYALLDTIYAYIDSDSVPIGEIVQKVQGVRIVNVKNNSWRAFLNFKIELIEYDYISTLSNIDGGQRHMEKQTDQLIDFIYSNLDDDTEIKKMIFSTLINDILHHEEVLLEDHEAFFALEAKTQPEH